MDKIIFETDKSGRLGTTPPSYKLNVKTMEQKKAFDPFEKILLKYKDDKSKWRCDLFSHIDEDKNSLETIGGSYSLKMFDYIPFEGNAHLL